MFLLQFGPVAEGIGTLASILPVKVATQALEGMTKKKKARKKRARAKV